MQPDPTILSGPTCPKNRGSSPTDLRIKVVNMHSGIVDQSVPFHLLKPMTLQERMPASPHTQASDPIFSDSFRKRFRDLDDAPFPFLFVDDEGTIRRVTNATRRLLEYRSDQPFDPCFFTHVHGRNLRRVMQDLAQVLRRHKRKVSWLLRLRTGTGRWRWFRAMVHPHPDEGNTAVVRLRRV